MDTRINTSFQFDASLGQGFSTDAPPMQGEFRGQVVVEQRDALSEIANAAEELTFAQSEHVEKKLSERKLVGKGSLSTSAVEKAEMYLQRMTEAENLDKASQFLQHLQKAGSPTSDQVLEDVRRFFGEPGEQHAALTFAAELLRGSGDREDLIETLLEARGKLENSFGTKPPAGITATSDPLARWQPDEATRQDLAAFHAETLSGLGNVLETYDGLLQRFGEARFHESLTFLIRATGSELHSGQQNIADAKLKTMVDDLFHVQVLGNVHGSLAELSSRIEKDFGLFIRSSPATMMRSVLALTQSAYCRGDQVASIAKQAGITEIEPSIYFLTSLKEHIRLIPVKIYPTPDNRLKLLEAAQEALDQAIALEEASFEE